MKILQRYILRELLINALFTLFVLTSIIVMVMFSIAALKTSLAALSFRALAEVVLLQAGQRLDVALPLTILVASLWTYGRARTTGEITAMRGAGIGLVHLIVPAVVVGASATLVLAWLQDSTIPTGHYRQMVIGRRHLAASIDALLMDDRRYIQDRRFKVTWESVVTDQDGYNVIRDVVVSERRKPDTPPVVTRARTAIPVVNRARGELTLTLEDIVHGDSMAARELTITLDLKALSEEPMPSKRTDDRTYEELLTAATRAPNSREGRKGAAEFHRRAATAFSATLYAVLGALLGLVLNIGNRAWAFAIGFSIVLATNFAPLAALIPAAASGALPPYALWAANGLLLATSVAVFLGAFRR